MNREIISITRGTIERSQENKERYDRKGYHMTGETLSIRCVDFGEYDTETTYVVFKGSWTRSYSIRDCGTHYIWATGYMWNRIDKETLEITFDVREDK